MRILIPNIPRSQKDSQGVTLCTERSEQAPCITWSRAKRYKTFSSRLMFAKKQKDLPKSNWKTWLMFSPGETKPKERKPIPKISKKKQERIKTEWSETDLFAKIWSERPHECEICGKVLTTPRAHNFDHVKPKSRGEAYRLDPSNIKIVCFPCHYVKTTKQVYKGIDLD